MRFHKVDKYIKYLLDYFAESLSDKLLTEKETVIPQGTTPTGIHYPKVEAVVNNFKSREEVAKLDNYNPYYEGQKIERQRELRKRRSVIA